MEVLKHRHKLGGWANVAGYVVVVVTVGLDAGIFYREVFGRSIGVGAGEGFFPFLADGKYSESDIGYGARKCDGEKIFTRRSFIEKNNVAHCD